ncbi:DUF2147 domain-containing protein [Roseateles sp. DAIF2]|uniref:DUF2147 domain-containing protein n=1 Tax=Roseateles sp. DAIF2 TaxID=2714952 RepID=UPI0018A2D910|nr:DUF2147 domain-containing protein [Roseateles sp. DAIF2]QPF72655.1 DUF2147 domain-containing protein [Roseateles sp. DAIF2]
MDLVSTFSIWRAGAAVLLLLLAEGAAAAADPRGRFLTESGNLEVEIAPCADPALLCGTVARVVANRSMARPEQAMAPPAGARELLGLQLLSGLRPDGEGGWQGRLYNRENGRHYDCRVALDEAGHLRLRAYVLLPLFGKSQLWRRLAEAPAPAAEAAASAASR